MLWSNSLPITQTQQILIYIDMSRIHKPNISDELTDDYLSQLYQSQGGNSTSGQREAGFAFSNVDLIKMQYDINQRDEERAYNQEMYEKYQTIPAQVEQMQEAGLNPALMYGDGASSPSSMSPSPEVDSSSASGSGRDYSKMARISQIFQMLSGGMQIASQINQQTANAQLMRSQARLNNIDARTRGDINDLTVEQMRSNIRNTDIDSVLKQTLQEVNKTHVKVNVTEAELNTLKSDWQRFSNRIASVDAEVAETTKDTIIAYKRAELSYIQAQENFTRSKTDEAKTSSALNVANAALAHANELLAMTKNLAESEMVDSGYYLLAATKQAEEVKKIQQDIKTSSSLKDVYDSLERLRGLEADNYKLEMWAGVISNGIGAVADVVSSTASGVGAAANVVRALSNVSKK